MKTNMLKYLFRTIILILISTIVVLSIVLYNFSSVVVVKPIGGLGNQIFQYVAAYSLAKETNSSLIVLIETPEKNLKNISNNSRYYVLDKFNIKADEILFTNESIKARYLLKLFNNENFFRKLNKKLSFSGHKVEFVDVTNFSSAAKTAKNKIYIIDDYFESEIFFKKYSDEIKQFLKLEVKDQEKLSKYFDKLKTPKSFCVHVRRGDISKTSNPEHLTPIDYQRQAIKLARELVDDPHFFIFSDSPEIVKQELDDKHNIEFISNKELNSLDDFALMNSCQNNIIASSTFSWWAAYLNPNPNKIVIAPYPKFTNEMTVNFYRVPVPFGSREELYKNHAYPESWKKLNYRLKRIE